MMQSEIENISKCFYLTKRITCSRKSNKLYIRKRKKRNNSNKVFLKKFNHNYIYYSKSFSIYLVVIITNPSEFYERFVFRRIYKYYENVSYIFAMGKSNCNDVNRRIKKEIRIHNDIIQFNFLASYYSLMLQTYNILQWCSQVNLKFNWLIKHDSDTFLNIKLLSDLHSISEKKYLNYIWGYIVKNFPSGMGYAIPYNLISKLLFSSLEEVNTNCYSLAEDVFIGRMASHSGIKLYDVRNFNISIGQGGCFINSIDYYLMIHRLKPSEIFFLHTIIYKSID